MATSKKSSKKSSKKASKKDSTKRTKKASLKKTAASDGRAADVCEVVTRCILRHHAHRPHGTGLADLSLWHDILEHTPRPEGNVEPTGRVLS